MLVAVCGRRPNLYFPQTGVVGKRTVTLTDTHTVSRPGLIFVNHCARSSMVEQRPFKSLVASSSLAGRTKWSINSMVEWSLDKAFTKVRFLH